MARRYSQTIPAPSGFDATTEAAVMPLDKARFLGNFQVDRGGLVRSQNYLHNQLPLPLPFTQTIDGLSYFYAAQVRNNQTGNPLLTDLIMFVAGQFLWIVPPTSDPFNSQTVQPGIVLGGITGYVPLACFFPGKRVRFFALADEMVMVQEGGLLPLRYFAGATYGQGFYQAGITPPTSSGTYANLTVTTSGTGLTGTWGYKLTFEDERGRESSPTPVLNITLANQGTLATWHSGYGGAYTGHNLVRANLYRNTIGVPSVFYRIQSVAVSGTSGNFPVDNATDASITSGVLCPSPGENDPPNPASVGIIYKNHVVLNDINNPNSIQMSNLLSTTQYTLIPTTPITATDGIRSNIGTDQGNVVTGFAEFGNYLAVFKRRNTYYMAGDTVQDFIVRPLYDKGCSAPDSICRCDNQVIFLSDDGIYSTSFAGGDVLNKISKEIEDLVFKPNALLSYSITAADREAATAMYFNRQYRISIGRYMFCYDMDRLGWTTEFYGSGAFPAQDGLPHITVTSGTGFSVDDGSPDAGIIGSLILNDPPPATGCSVTTNPTSLTLVAAGTWQDIVVTAGNEERITYSCSVNWLHVSGPYSGDGIATISADINTGAPRAGNVFICGTVIPVTQLGAASGCSMTSLTPSSFLTVLAAGQTVSTRYIEANDATIGIVSNSSWIAPGPAVNDGFRTGTIAIVVSANPGCSSRSGTVTVCDKQVTITQLAGVIAMSPSTLSFGEVGGIQLSITVTNTPAVTVWDLEVSDTWIVIDSATGVGSGTIVLHCQDNPGPSTRSGTVCVCGVCTTVNQAAPPPP